MLSLQQFKQLSYEEKKELLIGILTQLTDKKTDFSDMIFLLHASNKIQEKTINTMYIDLLKILGEAKELDYLKQKSTSIKKMMQNNLAQQQESDGADEILFNI